ncbi:MAG: PDDEXK nuclease domain-containing protein [Mediterranea sp.]|jgi:predicted nuclease of restriction endonuclease-like (RecB) superfamily|nr:PDDEXK nuclease domain-containing protein [Mediterranea sp.]
MKNEIEKIDTLYNKVAELIEQARKHVATTVNLTMVYTYYEIGRYIVEDEQEGSQRAAYGKFVLKELSKRLMGRFGEGFSERNLRQMRTFYDIYSQQPIRQTVSAEFEERLNSVEQISSTLLRKSQKDGIVSHKFTLSWSHYLVLMRVENPDARGFYEIEAAQQHWSVRQLARQCSSSLYERLALSRNKDEVMRLANEGQTMEKPADILRRPFTLEFLGMEERSVYTETELEERIISNIQKFLLEMGKGFLFEARQKRFTFDEDSFFVDLVLYNRLLQCYVLIDLKTKKLSHQDLGQMQMYVNYYDRYEKQIFEKPTIGILLCETANQSLVELTLPEDANIYAAQYALYLPDKTLLQQKLREWTDEFEEEQAAKKGGTKQ